MPARLLQNLARPTVRTARYDHSMTGIEGAAATGIVTRIVDKALAGDPEAEAALLKAAQVDPLWQRAGKEKARRVLMQQEAKTAFFRPLAELLRLPSYTEDDLIDDLADKMANVPEDNFIRPRLTVAAPAIHNLILSADEAELKDMYLNLLARASDSRSADEAHASFAFIIQQLSAEEAHLLSSVLQDGTTIARIRRNESDDTGRRTYEELTGDLVNLVRLATGEPVTESRASAWIDNWVRLGLCERNYQAQRAGEATYDWVETRPELADARQLHTGDKVTIDYVLGTLDVTSLGKQFAKITLMAPPPVPSGSMIISG